MDNYITFEYIRKDRAGGGLLTAVHKNLKPVSIGTDDSNEILVVEANIGSERACFINAYGPQESETEEIKTNFFSKLDTEIKASKMAGKMICIELDANSKLGSKINPNDPHNQSKNGKLFEEVISKNDLMVVNLSSLCEGSITRKGVTVNSTEESVIDYYIVCKKLFENISKMKIDEEGVYTLSKFSTRKGIMSIKPSDHNPLILYLNTFWDSHNKNKQHSRIEIFQFNDEERFEAYTALTENNDKLKECFKDDQEDVNNSSKRWLKLFNTILHKAFKKLRITKNKNSDELEKLFQEKENLKIKKSKFENLEDNENIKVMKPKIEK